ncbi:hypothetical protein ACFUVV_00910 [Streptomyces sp. NPDC057376]|uniref:hypothetical protein n=1 Tax=Streptomyces sp. NPDC057376 TaxID=3346110 RepID=UPI003630AD37
MKLIRAGRLARFIATLRPHNLGTVRAGAANIQVTRIAGGAALGLTDALRPSVIDLAEMHAEDPKALGSLLEEIWELAGAAGGRDSHARHELDERVAVFLEAVGAHEVRVYDRQVDRLAALLWECRGQQAPAVVVPAQRREGGAAA